VGGGEVAEDVGGGGGINLTARAMVSVRSHVTFSVSHTSKHTASIQWSWWNRFCLLTFFYPPTSSVCCCCCNRSWRKGRANHWSRSIDGVGQQAANEQSTIARSAVVTILIACMSWRSPVKCLCEDEKSDFKKSLKCCVLFDTGKISKHQITAAFHQKTQQERKLH
jgi:hypothetical protein